MKVNDAVKKKDNPEKCSCQFAKLPQKHFFNINIFVPQLKALSGFIFIMCMTSPPLIKAQMLLSHTFHNGSKRSHKDIERHVWTAGPPPWQEVASCDDPSILPLANAGNGCPTQSRSSLEELQREHGRLVLTAQEGDGVAE